MSINLIMHIMLHPIIQYTYLQPPNLPSFPTRRSSDLKNPIQRVELFEQSRPLSIFHKTRFQLRMQFDKLSQRVSCLFAALRDRKSTRLNSSHSSISYAVFCLKKKKTLTNAVKVSSSIN